MGNGAKHNDPCPCGSGKKAKRCHPDLIGAELTLSHRNAVHEAGHAVVAVHLVVPFVGVSVQLKWQEFEGQPPQLVVTGVDFGYAPREAPANALIAKSRIRVALAGGAAEAILVASTAGRPLADALPDAYREEGVADGMGPDVAIVRKLLRYVPGDGKENSIALLSETEDLLMGPLHEAHAAVTRALEECGELTHNEVVALVGRHLPSAPT